MKKKQAAINKAIGSSIAAKAIHERTGKERSRLLAEAVERQDKTIIPYLRALVEANWDGLFEVEVALVRLGEEDFFQKTVAEAASEDPRLRYRAVWKLSLFKSKEAYRKLYELLDDESMASTISNDAIVRSTSSLVKERLFQSVEDPPKGMARFDTAAWKAWFEKNRRLIE